MIRLSIFFFLALYTMASAVEIIDGQWNGKPWDKEMLQAKSKAGDPDAMAEWAYCSYFGENGIPHNNKQTFQYAVSSGKKGSILGKSLEGYLYILASGTELNIEKGLGIIDAMEKTKHPYARMLYAQSFTFSSSERVDLIKATNIFRELINENVAQASAVLGFFLDQPWSPIYDPKEAASILKDSFDKYESTISTFLQYKKLERTRRLYGDKYAEKVVKRLHKSAQIGHPSSLRTLAEESIESDDYDTGISYLLRSIGQADKQALNTLVHLLARVSKAPISSDYVSLEKLASNAYKDGSRTNSVVIQHIRNMRHSRNLANKSYQYPIEEIVTIARKGIAGGDCNIYDEISAFYLYEVTMRGYDDVNFDKGIQHAIYHIDHAPSNIYNIAYYLLFQDHPSTVDIPKGLAAAEAAWENLSPSKTGYLKKLVDQAKKIATPEEIAQSQELIKNGYPNAPKWREEAFKKLQDYGEIPKNWKFSSHRLR